MRLEDLGNLLRELHAERQHADDLNTQLGSCLAENSKLRNSLISMSIMECPVCKTELDAKEEPPWHCTDCEYQRRAVKLAWEIGEYK